MASSRLSFWRAVTATALTAAVVYAGIGTVLEALRRWAPSDEARRALLMLDALPLHVLMPLGVLTQLRDLWWTGELPAYALRLCLAGAMLAVIFCLSLVVVGLVRLLASLSGPSSE